MQIDSRKIQPYERLLVAVLCIVAGVRIFIFSAAFPFFNNSDEQAHYDLVYKYSRGRLPCAPVEKFDPFTSKIIGDYGSPEFLYDSFSRPIRWRSDVITAQYKEQDNHETWSWPSYYMLAGMWYRFGEVIGLTGKNLLYWIRFLNVAAGAIFVWLSWVISRCVFETGFQQRIAVPLLAVFFPQDIFYSITNDVLSPVAFAGAFVMLLEIYLEDKSRTFYFFTGLVVATTVLTKTTNVIIAVLAFVVLAIKLKQAYNQKQLQNYFACLSAFSIPFIVPIGLWLGRNYVLFGDVIGSSGAIRILGWTEKSFSEMFEHPILTPAGMIVFFNSLIRTFWRGEFFWEGFFKVLAYGPIDLFYVLSSFFFVIAALLEVFIKGGISRVCRITLVWALFVFIGSVLMLAVLSMRYDFGTCLNPSREFPFFVSGRLIAGAILPFLLIYVCGLNRLLNNLGLGSYLLVLVIVIVIAITASEIFISMPVFASPYNWFHQGVPT